MEPQFLSKADAAGKATFEAIKGSTSTLHWGDYFGHTLNNGSMFFLDTGVALFAVTARHVYDGYLRSKKMQPVVCQIDGLPFDPKARLISAGADLDIATFRITRAELRHIKKMTVPWPPVIPEEGNGVFVCGLLGASRLNPRPGLVDIGYYTSLMRVDSVSNRAISMMVQPNEEIVDIVGKGLAPTGLYIGGMSGGPVAALTMTQSGLIGWSISGVIYEGHQSFDIIKAVRADFIKEDGTLEE